jgi:hypothetical protein
MITYLHRIEDKAKIEGQIREAWLCFSEIEVVKKKRSK